MLKILRKKKNAFTIIEVTIASAILAICLLMVYSFMKPGMENTQKGTSSISDLSNMNLFLDYLKIDIRTCQKFRAPITSTPGIYLLKCLKSFSGTPDLMEVEYKIEEHLITRKEKNSSGITIKSKKFSFGGVIEFEMEKSTSYVNMIKITKLVLKRIKRGQFINLFATTSSTIANQIGLKSFYPEIYNF